MNKPYDFLYLEVERSESLISPRRYEELRESTPPIWCQKLQEEESLEALRLFFKKALDITRKQREAIELLF